MLINSLFTCLSDSQLFAQEAQENIDNATIYINHKASTLEKTVDITGSLQRKLLKRLQRKEDKMLRKLAKQDSFLYKQYIQQHLTYDSIAAISRDTSRLPPTVGNNTIIDSLKGIQRFIQSQEGKLSASSASLKAVGISIPQSDQLNALQQKLNEQSNIDQLIQQHTNDLKQLAGSYNINGLQSIQKDVYYAREKIKAYKELADDPDEAEQKALEYLQGTEGFDKYLNSSSGNNAFGGLGNDASAADLQRLGYQTKSSVSDAIQQKLGDNLGAIQQQMSQQIQQYSDKLNGLKQKADALKAKADEVKQGITDVQGAKDKLKEVDAPDFKPNKEKGKPFWQRITTQYNFQTSRATVDGLKPAMLNLGANIGYKQTERLSFGVGLALNTGLGRDWQHLKLSYEGISLRAFADQLFIYGFSFQVGYERAFIPANRPYLVASTDPSINNPSNSNSDNALQQAFGGQQQTAYIGIMKRYRISNKLSGTFLAGYNILWHEEGQRSPWILRLGWEK
ncbi:hypothetical protein MTO98_09435 [Mucilaginibacter sp. SMC90]|uniref:hypothetical protein n=1 Tax=Mucilaginibacter sp. SMC90 TaxID=2929803 RepID=UPI001FB34C32|nr:hypothetical protein [Mucilaginibacter sp. SMC90]UOE51299.1 hypothetical protein MTO98_09435 [Mucilaginibacter sp. SMC90]